ncbi:MAG: protein kinase [Candidatus Brocadiia bacterium]
MSDANAESPAGAGGLTEGVQLGGAELQRRVAADSFCSLWLTEPLEEGFAESCVRAIPVSQLKSEDAAERLQTETRFWKGLRDRHVVDLYECGVEAGYCYMLMRYIPQGSVARQAGRWIQRYLVEFALDFAAAIRSLHSSTGPHGNLKPTNVFPLRGEDVLLSDFMLPLWLDEQQAGNDAVRGHLQHPYRAPEQQINVRDYDTRSDIYSFGLILLRCLTGNPPAPGVDPKAVDWPDSLRAVARRCLANDPNMRFADGHELFETLCEASGSTASFVAAVVEGAEPEAPAEEHAPAPPAPPDNAPQIMAEARAKVDVGELEEALGLLEQLPPGTKGMARLLDEIEHREREGERLAEEAIRLAGMGQREAAVEAIYQAAELNPSSLTVASVKDELGLPEEGRPERDDDLPAELRTALRSGRYATARPLLEKLLREGAPSDALQRAVRQFKEGRVRKAFRESIQAARRLYLSGERQKAREYWLEAARWLPSGAERERLRRIARAAGKGKLELDAATFAQEGIGLGRAGRASGTEAPSRALQLPSLGDKARQIVVLVAVCAVFGLVLLALLTWLL